MKRKSRETVFFKERYSIKTPKEIRLYDEMYLNDSNFIDFCAIIENISKDKKTELIFELVEDVVSLKYSEVKILTFVVKLLIASDQEILDCFYNEKYYPASVEQQKELICDSSSFVIEIDDRYDDIYTGADGCYGQQISYKDNQAHFIEFCIDTDLISEKKLRKILNYLFDIKEIEEVKSYD